MNEWAPRVVTGVTVLVFKSVGIRNKKYSFCVERDNIYEILHWYVAWCGSFKRTKYRGIIKSSVKFNINYLMEEGVDKMGCGGSTNHGIFFQIYLNEEEKWEECSRVEREINQTDSWMMEMYPRKLRVNNCSWDV